MKIASLTDRLVADAARIVPHFVRYAADAPPLSTTDQVLIVHARVQISPPRPFFLSKYQTNMKTNKYRAEFRRNGNIIRTRFYSDVETAQNQLAKQIGDFNHLGKVAGDGFISGRCTDAPRNGGLVSIETRL